jgi:hypothetical protein
MAPQHLLLLALAALLTPHHAAAQDKKIREYEQWVGAHTLNNNLYLKIKQDNLTVPAYTHIVAFQGWLEAPRSIDKVRHCNTD